MMVEQNIVDALKYVDNSYKILEKYLNQDMREFSEILVRKYSENSNVMNWDLKELQDGFEDYEIYIIDGRLAVVRTTLKEDLGLDFSQFPNFAELLRERMAGATFSADRMDISTNTHKLKKYSYMPTPDHKYLLELSVDIQETNPTIEGINVFSHADTLAREHEPVKEISFYKTNKDGSQVGLVTFGKGPYLDKNIPGKVKQIIQETVLADAAKTTQESEIRQSHKYIPYLSYTKENELNWWNSYVVRIAYDDSILQAKLTAERNIFIGKLSLLAAIFVLFQLTFAYLFRRTEQMASLDSLTELPNRKAFYEHFKRITGKQNERQGSRKLALLFIDVDDFKAVNDKYGHNAGDEVLREVARVLKRTLRKKDMVIRAGGDEFLVLLAGDISPDDVETVVSKINEALTTPLSIDGKTIKIDVSIGVSLYPDNAETLQEMTAQADAAMYLAKKSTSGSTNWSLYASERPTNSS
ncbi:MAG: GGDEF domain-containing protein [Desulfohalobiaceae bacterium]|nr:GGDEF domain-containing protein [Desulfohalobiaceae bacterium]